MHGHSVKSEYCGGRKIWRKRYVDTGLVEKLSRAALGAIARWLDLPVLTPIPKCSGDQLRETEKTLLARLGNAGITVPQVLGDDGDCLLLSDIGIPLNTMLRQARTDVEVAGLLASALQAIDTLHQAGLCGSLMFCRNMAWSDERVGFLDFEEDPLSVINLCTAQARDCLCFLYTASVYLRPGFGCSQALIREFLDGRDPQVRREVDAVLDRVHALPDWLCRAYPKLLATKRMLHVLRTPAPSTTG